MGPGAVAGWAGGEGRRWGGGLRAGFRRVAFWGEGAQAQHATEWAEDAGSGGGCGEEVGDAGLGEEGFELGSVGGGLLREGTDQPAMAGGERGGSGGVRAVGPGWAGLWQAVGGDAGHQAVEAAGGAGEAGPERDDEGLETGVAEETVRHQGGEAGDDQAEPTGEVGGEGLDRGRVGCGGQGQYS